MIKVLFVLLLLYIFKGYQLKNYLKKRFLGSYPGTLAKPSNMEVNAAIERLVGGDDDEELMKTINRLGHKFQETASLTIQVTSNKKQDGTSLTGFTQEQGSVTVKADGEKQQKEKSFGIYKARVGYYRIYKDGWGAIEFHHFWKSDITTESESEGEPAKFRLEYDEKILKPLRFGRYGYKDYFFFILPTLKLSLRQPLLIGVCDGRIIKRLSPYIFCHAR